MKRILLCCFTLMTGTTLLAQEVPAGSSPGAAEHYKNEVKLNLLAVAYKSISVEYERQISRKTTVTLDLRSMPKSTLPFKSLFKNALSDTSTANQLDNFKTGNVAVTPSIRFYLGRRGAFHGFYIAPFVSYAHYTASLLYQYDDGGTTKTIPMSGSLNAVTGGFMAGAQWPLSKRVSIDWWILGPHYGISSGRVDGRQSLTPNEQDALKFELDNLNIPLVKTSNTVDGNGATVDFSGPWGGIRSGLCIGISF